MAGFDSVDAGVSLFDRDREIRQIHAALGDGEGRFLYVEGHAGIGKTRLLSVARSHAERRGMHVLSARGGELERDFGYGVVRQLFEAAVAESGPDGTRSLLDGPAAHAARAIGVDSTREGVKPVPDSPFPVIHALYWLTLNLSARNRLLLLLDDAHLADDPSLRFVDYLVGRIEGMPVSVAVAARPSDPGAPVHLLAGLRDGRGPVLVRPGPLGEEATRAVLRERLGLEPDPRFAVACRQASAGNPFLLHALVDALIVDGVAPKAEHAGIVTDLGPETVARSMLLRVGRLSPHAGEVVDGVAVFGIEAPVRHVAAVIGLTQEEVGDVADLLAGANVLSAERPLQFVHPVVREAVYGDMRASTRARLHARAAEVLLAEGQLSSQVAPHLLMTEPAGDEMTVRVLREGAAAAIGQGAADIAQTYLRRAVEEPPATEERATVLAELGLATALVGQDLERACEHLEASAVATTDIERRVDRVEEAARLRLYRGDLSGAVDLLEGVRDRTDADTELRITAHQAAIGLIAPPLARSAIARLEEFVDAPGDTPAELAALAELGGARWLNGEIEEAAGLAERGLVGGRLLEAEGPVSVPFNHAVRILIDADRREVALRALEAAVDLAREHGSLLGTASLLGLRVVAAWRTGDVGATEALARGLLDLLEASSTPVVDPVHWGYLALSLVERGELDAAEDAAVHSGVGPDLPALTYMGVPFQARARLRLAQGRPEDALVDVLELRSRDDRLGIRHLSIPWHRVGVEAALAVGDSGLAADLADEQLERAGRWRTPSGRGLALTTKGLTASGDRALGLLEEGAGLLRQSPARLDHARALVDLGTALRRDGRRAQAREPLRAGLDAARSCGARPLVEMAHRELTAAGAKPRRLQFSGVESLTASERRVAELAAAGQTNRQIAASLYVTVRTVENHLARTYRKLGIGSRKELASALV